MRNIFYISVSVIVGSNPTHDIDTYPCILNATVCYVLCGGSLAIQGNDKTSKTLTLTFLKLNYEFLQATGAKGSNFN
jgi:hypothetical protein